MSDSQVRVLIVDDRRNATTLSQMLESSGLQTHMAHSKHSAIQAFETNRYDLVLLDGDFNQKDGLHFLEALREHKIGAIVPVIILGRALAQSEIRSTSDAQALGADEFFKRPIKRARLLARVSALTGTEISRIQPEPARIIHLQQETKVRAVKDLDSETPLSTPLIDTKVFPVNFGKTTDAAPLPISQTKLINEIIALGTQKEVRDPIEPAQLKAAKAKATKKKTTTKKATKKKKVTKKKTTTKKATKKKTATKKKVTKKDSDTQEQADTKQIPEETSVPVEPKDKPVETHRLEGSGAVQNSAPLESSPPVDKGQVATVTKLVEPSSQALNQAGAESEFIDNSFFDENQEKDDPETNFESVIERRPADRSGDLEEDSTETSGAMMDVLSAELARRDDDSEAKEDELKASSGAVAEDIDHEAMSADTSDTKEPSEITTPTRKQKRVKTAYGLMAEMLADRPAAVTNMEHDQAPVDQLLRDEAPEIAHIPSRRRAHTQEEEEEEKKTKTIQQHVPNIPETPQWNDSKVAEVTASVIAAAETSAKEAVQDAFDELFQRFPKMFVDGPTSSQSQDSAAAAPKQARELGDDGPSLNARYSDHEAPAEAFQPPGNFDTVLPTPILDSQPPKALAVSRGQCAHLFDALILLEEFRNQKPTGQLSLADNAQIQITDGHPVCLVGSEHCSRLLLRFLDEGMLTAQQHQKFVQTGIPERPDYLLSKLAESELMAPTQVWNELDRLVDEAISQALVFRGPWIFGSSNRAMRSDLRAQETALDIRPRLSGLVQAVIPTAELIEELGEGRTRMVVIKWPDQLTLPQDRSFLRALDGRNSFDDACELTGVERGRAAALSIVLIALGYAKSLGEGPSKSQAPKFRVPSWNERQAEAHDFESFLTPEPFVDEEEDKARPEEAPYDAEQEDNEHEFNAPVTIAVTPLEEEDAIFEPETEEDESEHQYLDDDIPRAETLDTSEEDTDSESEIVNLEERYALMKTTSYFDILGVNEDDNSETITRAYHRELDRLSSQLAVLRPELLMMAEKFAQSLNEAHQVLIHPVLRDRYRRHQNRAGRQ